MLVGIMLTDAMHGSWGEENQLRSSERRIFECNGGREGGTVLYVSKLSLGGCPVLSCSVQYSSYGLGLCSAGLLVC